MRPVPWKVLAPFVLSVTILGCNDRDLGEPAEPVEELTVDEADRDAYVRGVEQELDALENRLELARRDAVQEGRELDAETDRHLQSLEADLETLRKDLAAAGEQAEANWQDFSRDVDRRTERLEEELRTLDLDVDADVDLENR